MRLYYVYIYIDPRNNFPFYIGRGKNDRCYKHSKETSLVMSQKAKARPSNRKGTTQSKESKFKIQINNPNRKAIHTPFGSFYSAEEFLNQTGLTTANALRGFMKDLNKPISEMRAARSPILTLDDIAKTPKQIGYYFIEDYQV